MTSDDATLTWLGEWMHGGAVTGLRRDDDGTLTVALSLVQGVEPVDPFVYSDGEATGGTTPVANAPRTLTGAESACGLMKVAVTV